MKKYVKLLVSNLIAITVYVLISLYFRSIEQSAGLGAVVVGLWVLDFVIYNYSFISAIDVISQYARRIMVALPFSLIPSIITKVIMLIADKCRKAKSQKQDGQTQA